jgi:4-diphosphocytidyl-2-C-methyl-D-erythritol kinase
MPDLPSISCVVVTPEIGVSTPQAFAKWDQLFGVVADNREGGITLETEASAEVRSAGLPMTAVPTREGPKLTVVDGSARMNELSYRLSAWLSGQYSGAPVGRGRAENPLLALVRTGIKNDFEQVVFPEYPELDEAKAALLRAGAKYASLSGSGSTLYGLFATKASAERATARLQKLGWAAQVTRTLPRSAYWRRLFVR